MTTNVPDVFWSPVPCDIPRCAWTSVQAGLAAGEGDYPTYTRWLSDAHKALSAHLLTHAPIATPAEQGQQGPRWVELVEIARVQLNPGETLVIKPRDCVAWFDPEAAEELHDWLEPQLGGIPLVVLPMQVDLGVIAQSEGAD